MMNHNLKSTLVLNRDMQPLSMLPISTVHWETAIKMIYNDQATIIHEYDDWEVHSPSITMNVPSVIMVSKYVNRSDRRVPWRDEYLWLRDGYKCQYCGDTQKLTMDHVIPRRYGGRTNYENIVAACAPCNHKKGDNAKIVPKQKPKHPSYWELVEKSKKHHALVIPDQSWELYLGWPSENMYIKSKK